MNRRRFCKVAAKNIIHFVTYGAGRPNECILIDTASYIVRKTVSSGWRVRLRCERTKVRITPRTVVFVATAAAIYSLGHRLRTSTAVPRSTQFSTLPPRDGTRSSAIAEGPRDASCQLKSCQLPRNSAETTYTTTPDQIDGMKLEI